MTSKNREKLLESASFLENEAKFRKQELYDEIVKYEQKKKKGCLLWIAPRAAKWIGGGFALSNGIGFATNIARVAADTLPSATLKESGIKFGIALATCLAGGYIIKRDKKKKKMYNASNAKHKALEDGSAVIQKIRDVADYCVSDNESGYAIINKVSDNLNKHEMFFSNVDISDLSPEEVVMLFLTVDKVKNEDTMQTIIAIKDDRYEDVKTEDTSDLSMMEFGIGISTVATSAKERDTWNSFAKNPYIKKLGSGFGLRKADKLKLAFGGIGELVQNAIDESKNK